MATSPEPTPPDSSLRALVALIGCGALVVLIGVGMGIWAYLDHRADEEAEVARRDAAVAALDVGRSPVIGALVADHGFAVLEPGGWPMIPYPEDLDSRFLDWVDVSSHGDVHRAAVPDRGAIVLVEGETASLDPSHHELRDEDRADTIEEVRWVALVRRTTFPDAYDFEDRSVGVEQVDLRVVRVADGVLIAQGTYRAMPPEFEGFPVDTYTVDAGLVAMFASGARDFATQAEPFLAQPSLEHECPAERSLAPPSIDLSTDPSCDQNPAEADGCRAHCLRGHPESCWRIGLAIEDRALAADPDAPTPAAASAFFLRACHYGLGSGCTNWAAGRLHSLEDVPRGEAQSHPGLACVARVMSHACELEDDWGCAMLERMRLEGQGLPRSPEAAHQALQARCDEGPSAACSILGEYQARGAFGLEARAAANASFARACESGWVPGACEYRVEQFSPDLLPVAASTADPAN